MNLRLKVVLFCVTLVFLFPESVRANDIEKLYYMSFDGPMEIMLTEDYEFVGYFSTEEKALVLFTELFGDNDTYPLIPAGVEIINIYLFEGCLYLNVTEEICSYGGGSAFEVALKEQIIRTALSLPGVRAVTLLIEGELKYLPEGSLLDEETETAYFIK